MGISASSLLDETKANYIKGEAEAELKSFSPCYRKQFSVAYFSQVQDQLEQHKEQITQLLKQREAPEDGEVLYEEGVLFFDETRKWRERYVVVRANYCLECHDSLETFVKGVPPRQKLLPTGGAVLTTEEKYMAMVDKCFPDDTNNVKEEFGPPLSGMPGQFPVYLRLPYRRDSYFCFRQEAKQAGFLSILSDCIRHQNQDFLKKKTCEVQAFLKAVQLYRQEKGRYEAWDMLIGSDVRVMANLVMEQLLPSLEKDMLPRLKAKKTEKKRVWFATVEAAYILVQERLLEGLSALKEECRTAARQQEVLIHSDMDQINGARALLEGKIKARVSEQAEKLCAESVQPYLASVLEELMEPISSGFQEARQLSDSAMDQICQDYQVGGTSEDLKRALAKLSRPNLLSCYQRISSLQEKLHHLQERFGFSNITSLIHSAQIDLQQLVENAANTFEQLLNKAVQDHPDNAGSAIEKAKHRVLKQYDYDSSTVRKRIFQDGLVAITLPHIKKNLAPTCKSALQDLEQFIYTDHSNFVHVENVYEGILLQTLDKEVTRVVKEAANHKKHNLFTDSRDVLSQSSRSSLSSPSTPGSPARVLGPPTPPSPDSPAERQAQSPPSPLVGNGLAVAPEVALSAVTEELKETTEAVPLAEAETAAAAVVASVLAERVEETETDPGVAATRQAEEETKEAETAAEIAPVPTETPKEDVPTPPETAAAASETTTPAETETVDTPAAPETVPGEEVVVMETVTEETSVEPETRNTDAPVEAASPETPGAVESLAVETDAPQAAATTQIEVAVPRPDPTPSAAPEPALQQTPVDAVAESVASLTVTTTEEEPAGVTTVITTEEEPVSVTTVTAAEEEPASVTTVTTTEEEPASATTVTSTQGDVESVTECKSGAEAESEAPSSGAKSVTAPPDGCMPTRAEDMERVEASDPSSLNVSVGSDSEPSDPGSYEGSKEYQSSEDDASATSDRSEDEVRASESPVSSDDGPAVTPVTPVITSEDVSPQAPTEDVGGDPNTGEVTADANANVESESTVSVEAAEVASDSQAPASAEPAAEAAPAGEASGPGPTPLGSIREIRDLVVEVIEVEELVQRYPCGVPKAEDD